MHARRNAGLGDPPSAYYTNDPESANAIIKRAVGFKENEISDFIQEMMVLLGQQREDVESALSNTGPYKLAENFCDHLVLESVWFAKTVQERGRLLKKFHAQSMMTPTEMTGSPTHSPVEEEIQRSVTPARLLVNLERSSIKSVPQDVLKLIQSKAESLLHQDGAIVQAPGKNNNSVFMIESQTSSKPHFVQIYKKWQTNVPRTRQQKFVLMLSQLQRSPVC